MTDTATIRAAVPADLMAIERDPASLLRYGEAAICDEASSEATVAGGASWTAKDAAGRILCCMGLFETFGGSTAIAWSIFAPAVGIADKRAITRFARDRIAESSIPRIEAISPANDAEAILHAFPDLDPGQLLAAVMTRATPQCRWARAIGLNAAGVLRKFGASGETHVMFERIR